MALVAVFETFDPGKGADRAVQDATTLLLDSRFYPLFALLFGWGLARQLEHRATPSIVARLLWLGMIGFLHSIFLWHGDILLEYAVFGVVLLVLRPRSAGDLVFWMTGAVLLPFVVFLAADGFPGAAVWPPFDPAIVMRESAIYASGSFGEILEQRWTDHLRVRFVGAFSSGVTLAMMALGFRLGAVVRDPRDHARSFRLLVIPLLIASLIGGVLTVAASHGHFGEEPTLGIWLLMNLTVVGGAAGAIAYLCIAAIAYGRFPDVAALRWLANLGRVSLSVYLLESVVFALIFNGYGLGLFGSLSWSACVALAAAVYVVALLAANLWLRKFERGPVEALLRRVTAAG